MSLLDFLHHHQLSLMRAGAAGDQPARRHHDRTALTLAWRIENSTRPVRSNATPLVPTS